MLRASTIEEREQEAENISEEAEEDENHPKRFRQAVLGSQEFWLVLVLDNKECSACKTAITNMMRLSAGLRGLAEVSNVVGMLNIFFQL